MFRPKSCLGCIILFVEVIVIPGLAIVAFIFSVISAFEYAESFRTKVHYKYEFIPFNSTSSSDRYVRSSVCSPTWTQEKVDYVNYMDVNYIYGLFIISIIINALSLISNNLTRIFKYFIVSESSLFWFKLISGICTYLALVFSVPALYATRMKYGKCLKTEGIMKDLLSVNAYTYINAGMWSTLALPLYYFSKLFCNSDWCDRGDITGWIIKIMWILGLAYLVFALVSKYSSFVLPQFGWDLCLNFDLFVAIFKLCPWQCFRGNRVGLLS